MSCGGKTIVPVRCAIIEFSNKLISIRIGNFHVDCSCKWDDITLKTHPAGISHL